jgi:hypothetical protein
LPAALRSVNGEPRQIPFTCESCTATPSKTSGAHHRVYARGMFGIGCRLRRSNRVPDLFLLVFPQTLEDDLIGLLDHLRVSGFTQSQKVTGRGPRGRHYDTAVWPGADSTIFTVVGPEQTIALSQALCEFNARLSASSRGLYGVRVFTWACKQLA